MSLLGPTCVASNGNTLYAFVNTGYSDTAAITLAVSNTAPASLANLSWKVISTVPQKNLNTISGFAMVGQIDCVVDDKGVFTVMSLSTKPANSDNPLLTKPAGLQYSPATNTWINIDSSADYKWALSTGSALFEVTSGATSALMQIYGTGVTSTTSSVAVYDPSTQTMVQRNATWAANAAVTPDGAPPTSPKTVALALGDTCMVYSSISLKSVVRENLYYLFCGDSKQTTFSWFTYDGTKLSAPTVAKVAIQQSAGFLPLGPAGSPATWAFMYDTTGVYGVTLAGAQAGAWQTLPYKFNITGAPGSGGSGSGGGGGGGNGGSGVGSGSGIGSLGGLSTGTLAGIIAGAVVVLFAILCTVWRRKKNSAKPAQVAQQPALQPFHPAQPPSQQGDDHHTKPTVLPATTVQAPFAPQQHHYPTKYYQSPHSEAPASVQSPHSEALAPATKNYHAPHTIYIPPTTTSAPHTIPSTPGNPSTIWSPPAYYGNPQQYAQEQHYAVNNDPRAPQLYPTAAAPQSYPPPPGYLRAPQERNEYAQ
ncbi:hypothetical protein BG000_001582 [Podila horticola]|nr:hypothetical protein BG000_001582 [Podila horticola]